MARNGAGVYSNPYPNFVNGTVISSDEADANNAAIATALTQSIAVDGQTTITANLPMNSKKFTGLAVGTAATDSLTLGQAQAQAFAWGGTAGGGADAITISPTPAITAYAVGQKFFWIASGSANTGAATIAISGLSAIAMQDGGAALAAGVHAAGKVFMGVLNTTSTVQIMQVQSSGDPLTISALTVNGTSQFSGAIIQGVDGTGYDATFFGDTSGAYLMWDQSADKLLTAGGALIDIVKDKLMIGGTAVTTTAAELNFNDTATAGTVVASKTVVASADKDIASFRNITLTGELDAGSLDVSGGADIAGQTTIQNGSAGAPSLAASADTNTGLYYPAADTVGVVTGGVEQFRFGSNPIPGGSKNLIQNPAMTVAQRGTSEAAVFGSASGYGAWPDGFRSERASGSESGRATFSQDSSGPAGFANCLKVLETTTDSSPGAGDLYRVVTRVEAQNLQHLAYGNAAAKTTTLSFYVFCNLTGAFAVVFSAPDGSRYYSTTYTVDVANTWEKKTITVPGDASGTITDDTGLGLEIGWCLGSGSNFQGGTQGSWAASANNMIGAGQTNNVLGSSSGDWRITGVQLEVGSVATDFEHEAISTTLAKCQRYFMRYVDGNQNSLPNLTQNGATGGYAHIIYPTTMRTTASLTVGTMNLYGLDLVGSSGTPATIALAYTTNVSTWVGVTWSSAGSDGDSVRFYTVDSAAIFDLSAEL